MKMKASGVHSIMGDDVNSNCNSVEYVRNNFLIIVHDFRNLNRKYIHIKTKLNTSMTNHLNSPRIHYL